MSDPRPSTARPQPTCCEVKFTPKIWDCEGSPRLGGGAILVAEASEPLMRPLLIPKCRRGFPIWVPAVLVFEPSAYCNRQSAKFGPRRGERTDNDETRSDRRKRGHFGFNCLGGSIPGPPITAFSPVTRRGFSLWNQSPRAELSRCGMPQRTHSAMYPSYAWPRFGGAFSSGTSCRAPTRAHSPDRIATLTVASALLLVLALVARATRNHPRS